MCIKSHVQAQVGHSRERCRGDYPALCKLVVSAASEIGHLN